MQILSSTERKTEELLRAGVKNHAPSVIPNYVKEKPTLPFTRVQVVYSKLEQGIH